MDKQELALVLIDRLKKGSTVHGCESQCSSRRLICKVPGCQCTGRSHTGRDRRNCKTMRTGQE